MRENFNFGFFGKEEHVKLMSYKALNWKGTIQFKQNKGFFFSLADSKVLSCEFNKIEVFFIFTTFI